MLSTRDRQAKYKAFESIRKVRIANLRALAQTYGGWTALGQITGHSCSFLTAVAGPNPRRSFGEVLARDLERTLKLKPYYLDLAH